MLKVKDTGTGLDDKQQKQIFKEFARLGLSLIHISERTLAQTGMAVDPAAHRLQVVIEVHAAQVTDCLLYTSFRLPADFCNRRDGGLAFHSVPQDRQGPDSQDRRRYGIAEKYMIA